MSPLSIIRSLSKFFEVFRAVWLPKIGFWEPGSQNWEPGSQIGNLGALQPQNRLLLKIEISINRLRKRK